MKRAAASRSFKDQQYITRGTRASPHNEQPDSNTCRDATAGTDVPMPTKESTLHFVLRLRGGMTSPTDSAHPHGDHRDFEDVADAECHGRYAPMTQRALERLVIQRGLPCTMHASIDNDHVQIDLEPRPGWQHLATPSRVAQAPHPYHISLCYSWDLADGDYQRLSEAVNGCETTLLVTHVTYNYCAVIDEACLPDVAKDLHKRGWHGDYMISM